MQRHRKRLGHRAFVVADAVGQAVRLVRLDDDLLPERALPVRRAHRAAVVAHVQAVVLQAHLAEAAQAAWLAGADRDTVAGGEAGHLGAGGFDDAGDFMAEHHRLFHANGAEAAMLVVVQVGAADAAAANADAQLAGAEIGGRYLLDAQVAGGVDDEGFHRLRFLFCGFDE